MGRRFLLLLLLTALFIIISDRIVLAAAPRSTYTVNKSADSDDGVCNRSDCSLREAIAAANGAAGADIINFDVDVSASVFLSLGSAPQITSDITINCEGMILFALHSARILTIDSGVVELNNCVLQNGDSPDSGGAILNRGGLTINGGSIKQNKAAINGGGIFNRNGGTLALNGVTVEGNDSVHGAGIFNGGELNVSGSIFSDNGSLSGNLVSITGGAISNHRTAIIRSNSRFTTNEAQLGGAIFNDSDAQLSVDDSALNNNQADEGGAIANFYQMTLTNAVLRDNQAIVGGAVSGDEMTIDRTTFENNSASADGGAVYIQFNNIVTLTNSTLTANSATDLGGGLFIDGSTSVTLDNTIVMSNTAGQGGGIYNFGGVIADSSTIAFNSADDKGGGIFNQVTFVGYGLNITGNVAEDGNNGREYGGGIYNKGVLSLSGGVLSANSVDGHAGALFNEPTGIVNINNVLVADNHANDCVFGNFDDCESVAGAFKNEGTMTLTQVTMRNNQVDYGSGGAVFNSGTLDVTQSTFDSNIALLSTSNPAPVGAITNVGTLTVQDSYFTENSGYRGGAIASLDDGEPSQTTISGSTFENNSAEYGAVIYAEDTTVTVSNSTLTGNSADQHGGAAYFAACCQQQTDVAFYNVTIADNVALGSGAAGGGITLFGDNNDVRLYNTIVADNVGGDCVGAVIIPLNAPNLDSDGSCGASLTADPLLAPLADNGGFTQTREPAINSPAVDAGSNTLCNLAPVNGVDQRNYVRANVDGNSDASDGNSCDLGAHERAEGVPTAVTLTSGHSTSPPPAAALLLLLVTLLTVAVCQQVLKLAGKRTSAS